MTFLEKFDELEDKEANAFLFAEIIHNYKALFEELRENRPILKFWSHHPGNADLQESRPGDAYLLSKAVDVKHALQNFSMLPYNKIPPSPFVLTIDNKEEHKKVRASMERALGLDNRPQIGDLIQAAVDAEWSEVSNHLGAIDVRAYVRNVALRFTGTYFGIAEEDIFSQVKDLPDQLKRSVSGIECLKQWSGEGYENFIWKIHARHFGSPEPQLQHALRKVGFIVNKAIENRPPDDTVISRFMQEMNNFSDPRQIVVNIIGAIQGLVDNAMTGACYALNQFIAKDQLDTVRRLPISELIEKIRLIHVFDTPSPFLPRRGALGDLPSYGVLSVLNQGTASSRDTGMNFVCAIGSALSDPANNGEDIRLGYGMHACVGRDIGDEIKARALAKILNLQQLKIIEPLEKQWGWIVKRFEVAGEIALSPEEQRIARNRAVINRAGYATTPRPRPFGCWSASEDVVNDYTSWPTLADQSFFSRHLEPASITDVEGLPNNDSSDPKTFGDVTELFRREGKQIESRSSLLFAFFAQWLTDSFLRTDPSDRRKTTSNHQIDMCQLYGLDEATTNILRTGMDGTLKTEPTLIGEGEYPPFLFDASGQVKPEFRGLPYVVDGRYREILDSVKDAEAKKKYYFATGLERGNSTCGYAALSTLFLREHNRISKLLKEENSKWDDERLFQTARMVVIALELKIVVEEYINHINGRKDLYSLDADFAEKEHWYRTNWVSLEFDLLYRWHSLVPNEMKFGKESYTPDQFRANNEPLVTNGLAKIFAEASKQSAGQIGLFNTPTFLLPAEEAALKMSRRYRVKSYNQYRKQFGLPAITHFDNFPAGDDVKKRLENLYGSVDKVEFLVGLYAENKPAGSNLLFGTLMTAMVAHDAFTHALTNPLLSKNVFNARTFTRDGWDIIQSTKGLDDILSRNSSSGGGLATFDYESNNKRD